VRADFTGRRATYIRRLWAALTIVLIAGCSSGDNVADLEAKIEDLEAQLEQSAAGADDPVGVTAVPAQVVAGQKTQPELPSASEMTRLWSCRSFERDPALERMPWLDVSTAEATLNATELRVSIDIEAHPRNAATGNDSFWALYISPQKNSTIFDAGGYQISAYYYPSGVEFLFFDGTSLLGIPGAIDGSIRDAEGASDRAVVEMSVDRSLMPSLDDEVFAFVASEGGLPEFTEDTCGGSDSSMTRMLPSITTDICEDAIRASYGTPPAEPFVVGANSIAGLPLGSSVADVIEAVSAQLGSPARCPTAALNRGPDWALRDSMFWIQVDDPESDRPTVSGWQIGLHDSAQDIGGPLPTTRFGHPVHVDSFEEGKVIHADRSAILPWGGCVGPLHYLDLTTGLSISLNLKAHSISTSTSPSNGGRPIPELGTTTYRSAVPVLNVRDGGGACGSGVKTAVGPDVVLWSEDSTPGVGAAWLLGDDSLSGTFRYVIFENPGFDPEGAPPYGAYEGYQSGYVFDDLIEVVNG